MKEETLKRAIKIYDSINCIDYAADFVSKHESVFITIQSGFKEGSQSAGFTKEVQGFLIYEALPMYRKRLVDELDKL